MYLTELVFEINMKLIRKVTLFPSDFK